MSYARCMVCNRIFHSFQDLQANNCHPNGGLAMALSTFEHPALVVHAGTPAQELKKLLDDIKALDRNPAVYEPWCGDCDGVIDGMEATDTQRETLGRCECKEPGLIFVGYDQAGWEACGELEDLVKRAKTILADVYGLVTKGKAER